MSGYVDFQEFMGSDSKAPDSFLDICKYRQLPTDFQTNTPPTLKIIPDIVVKSESFDWRTFINRHTSIRQHFYTAENKKIISDNNRQIALCNFIL